MPKVQIQGIWQKKSRLSDEVAWRNRTLRCKQKNLGSLGFKFTGNLTQNVQGMSPVSLVYYTVEQGWANPGMSSHPTFEDTNDYDYLGQNEERVLMNFA